MNRSPFQSLRRAGALAAVAAAALAAAPPAAPAAQVVAAGPGGSAHFAFVPGTASGLVYERTLAGDGTLGPAQPVSWGFRYGFNPSIAVDASGTALIAWTSTDGGVSTAYVRRRAADGALDAPQRLSPAGVAVTRFKLAVEPDGDSVAVWMRDLGGYDVVQARRRSADGTLGQVQTLSSTAADADDADVALAPTGAATVIWRRDIEGEMAVQTRTLAPGGALSGYQRVSPEGGSATDPLVSVNDAGRAVIAWFRTTADGRALEARPRAATGTLGAVQTIADGQYISAPAIGANAAGRVAFAWARQLNGTTWAVDGRIRQTDGSLGPRFDVGQGSGNRPVVAVDPNGHVTFAWRKDTSYDAIETRRRTYSGSMPPAQTLSAPATNNISPHLVVDGAGKATLAWYETDSNRWRARTVAAAVPAATIHDLESGG